MTVRLLLSLASGLIGRADSIGFYTPLARSVLAIWIWLFALALQFSIDFARSAALGVISSTIVVAVSYIIIRRVIS